MPIPPAIDSAAMEPLDLDRKSHRTPLSLRLRGLICDGDLGRLDAAAIETVREQAWPTPRHADEMHDTLMGLGGVTVAEGLANPQWGAWLAALAKHHRAARVGPMWFAAERLPQACALYPAATPEPAIEAPAEFQRDWEAGDALVELLRGRLSGLGPVAPDALATALGLPRGDVDAALLRLEGQGYAMRGRFTPGAREDELRRRIDDVLVRSDPGSGKTATFGLGMLARLDSAGARRDQ